LATTTDLITIKVHTDDETGMYRIGEIDFGIHTEVFDRWVSNDPTELAATLVFMANALLRREPTFYESNRVGACLAAEAALAKREGGGDDS
jgi:hypothetical protein